MSMKLTVVKVSVAEWSRTPGARYRRQGNSSAEEFRDDHLIPALEFALANKAVVLVNIDDVAGYTIGFLEEVFGGMRRKFGTPLLTKSLMVECTDDELGRAYLEDIEGFLGYEPRSSEA